MLIERDDEDDEAGDGDEAHEILYDVYERHGHGSACLLRLGDDHQDGLCRRSNTRQYQSNSVHIVVGEQPVEIKIPYECDDEERDGGGNDESTQRDAHHLHESESGQWHHSACTVPLEGDLGWG